MWPFGRLAIKTTSVRRVVHRLSVAADQELPLCAFREIKCAARNIDAGMIRGGFLRRASSRVSTRA
jgi:hypothetical protein